VKPTLGRPACQRGALDAAAPVFDDRRLGSLTSSQRADRAVSSADPLRVPPGELWAVTVDATVAAGRVHVSPSRRCPRSATPRVGDRDPSRTAPFGDGDRRMDLD
jgi:hypothetical protein